MAEPITVEPDLEFTREIIEGGGDSLKKCFQCGACSVTCTLSPNGKPFPRKEMIWASWGLRDKLINDPDIWLCHQCGDCTTNCPRGAKPGDVLSSLRDISYRHFAAPSFMGKALGRPAYLPIVLAIPVIFIIAVMSMAGTLKIPEGDVHFAEFFPHAYLNTSFTLVVILAASLVLWRVKRFWVSLTQTMPSTAEKHSLLKCFISSIIEIAKHDRFRKCSAQGNRFYSHLLVLWGFVLLLVATSLAIVMVLLNHYPLPIHHPIKIVGNIGGLMLIIGCSMMIYQRTANKEVIGNSSFYDWAFLVCLLGVGLTGVAVQLARLMNAHSAYYLYFIHLIFVFYLIVYVPYTKFGHFVYRTVAMTYSKYIGRE